MIHYDLLCAADHRFDGWFRDSVAFDQQAAHGLLECPVCGGANVRRALMAPAVPRRRRSAQRAAENAAERAQAGVPAPSAVSDGAGVAVASAPGSDHPGSDHPAVDRPGTDRLGSGGKMTAPAPADAGAMTGANMPAQLRALLQKMRAEVEQRCDYVGSKFAETARRMHEGELDARGIYGETTPDEAEALREDGIAVASIPWLPRADG